MWDFIIDYAPQIVPAVAIITTMSPFLRSRIVSDKNMLKIFGNIKETAKKVNFKEIDIMASIDQINRVTKTLNEDINNNIKRIDQTILEFTNSEIYTKMLQGLSQLDELNQLLQLKDSTIQDLGIKLKEIEKKL